MGGGPSREQKDAARSQAELNRTLVTQGNQNQQFANKVREEVVPFAKERMYGGLPYKDILLDSQSGLIPRAFLPARVNAERRLLSFGDLPSGYAETVRRRIDADQAQAYDDAMAGILTADEDARLQGANLLIGERAAANPLPYYSGATSGNNTILQADVLSQPTGLQAIIGGAAGNMARRAINAIPF